MNVQPEIIAARQTIQPAVDDDIDDFFAAETQP